MRLVPGVAVMAVGLCLAVPFARGVELYEGTYSTDSLHGTFVQWGGGTASVSAIVHQLMRAFHWDTITIYDGVFKSGQIDCTELNGYASFSQYGGVHVNSNGITLASSHERFVNQGSSYRMNGGTLMTPSFGLDGGSYSQGGGTNVATSFGIAAPGYAHIEGGTLRTSILAVSGILTYSRPAGTYLAKAVYWQSGGTTIAEDFVVANGADAHIENGALHTSNLTVNGGAGTSFRVLRTAADITHTRCSSNLEAAWCWTGN